MDSGEGIRDFTDLIVWQRAIKFGRLIYHLSSPFPIEEKFGLTSQIREFRSFLSIAKGSTAEVESQLLFGAQLGYVARRRREGTRAGGRDSQDDGDPTSPPPFFVLTPNP